MKLNVVPKKTLVFSLVAGLALVACSRDKVPPTVTATPAGGNYETPQQVALAANEEGASIFYTTDGSEPTQSSAAYSGPVAIDKTTTLKFIGVDKAKNASAPATETYTITPPDTNPPTVSAEPMGGTYDAEQQVTLTAQDAEGSATTIYYSEDGSEPTDASPTYSAPVAVAKNMTLKFFAKDEKGNASPVSTEEYKIAAKKGGKKK